MSSVVNRYYDPTTDQFLSIDPAVAVTDQPYVFTNDNPLNSEDPLGTIACGSDNQQAQCRTGYSITVWAASETVTSGLTMTITTAAVTVSGASANTSVTMNISPDGSVDVSVGNRVGVDVPLTTVIPTPSNGIVFFTASSGSVEAHGDKISANVGVTVINFPPPTSGPSWARNLSYVLAGVGAFLFIGPIAVAIPYGLATR